MQINHENTLLKGVLMGTATCMISMLFAVFAVAMLVYMGRVSDAAVNYGTLIILMFSALMGSAVAVKVINEKRILSGVITALLYGLTLLGITALFFDGMYQGVWITLFTVIGMGLIPGLIGVNRKNNRKIKAKYRMNR